jgi:hypothetical protein
VLALDAIYFLILGIKNKDKKILPLFFYSLILLVSGFVFTLIITNIYFIDTFTIIWPIVAFIFLDSTCHQIYQTKRADFVSLKNVISYINLLIIFLLTAGLLYLNIFLTFPWWGILPIFFVCVGVIIFCLFRFNGIELRESLIYGAVLSLIFSEILGGLLLLPGSFYVLAIVEAVAYYYFISLFMLSLNHRLGKNVVIRYTFLSMIILVLAIITGQWF